MRLRALLLRLTENLLILGFAAMIAMVFGNVVLRYGFDSGIIVSEEVSRMIFVWLSFGGAFLVARDGGHLGLTGFVLAMGRRGRWICRLVTECLSLLCMLLLISGCWTQTLLNLENYAPVSGIPQAVTYMAGLACGETSIRCTCAASPRACSASASSSSFSPLPHPNSTIVAPSSSPSAATIAAPCCASSRVSARVMRYHGSRQIASKRLDPRSSYRYFDCNCFGVSCKSRRTSLANSVVAVLVIMAVSDSILDNARRQAHHVESVPREESRITSRFGTSRTRTDNSA